MIKTKEEMMMMMMMMMMERETRCIQKFDVSKTAHKKFERTKTAKALLRCLAFTASSF